MHLCVVAHREIMLVIITYNKNRSWTASISKQIIPIVYKSCQNMLHDALTPANWIIFYRKRVDQNVFFFIDAAFNTVWVLQFKCKVKFYICKFITLFRDLLWVKGTVRQIEKALINDRLRVLKVSWKSHIPTIHRLAVIYQWNLLFS